MAVDVTKINHEPMFVIFNGVELGYVREGEITVSFSEEWVDQMAHQTGNRVVESFYKGGGAPSVNIGLLQVQELANWAVAFPTGSAQSDGGSGTRFSPTLVTAGASTPHIGQKASAYAQVLVLRPAALYVNVSTETARDLWFPKAWCSGVGDIQYGVDQAVVLDCTFRALYVPGAAEGEHVWVYGLKTGAWVDA